VVESYHIRKVYDRLYGLVVTVPGYRSRGLGSIPGATRFSEKQSAWNGFHSTSWGYLRSYLKEIAAPVWKTKINGRGDSLRWPLDTLYLLKVRTNFADKRRSLGQYSSLADYRPRSFSLFFCLCTFHRRLNHSKGSSEIRHSRVLPTLFHYFHF
jgi:hypothetical protein